MTARTSCTPVGDCVIMHGGKTPGVWLLLGPLPLSGRIRPTIAYGRFRDGAVRVVSGDVGPDVMRELSSLAAAIGEP